MAAAGPIIAKLIVSALLAYFSQKMMTTDLPSDVESGIEIKGNTRSTKKPVRLVYGKRRVGGNDVFIQTTDAKNSNLWIIQTLSEGPCDSINQVDGIDQIFIDDELYTDMNLKNINTVLIDYHFYSGTANQTLSGPGGALITEFIADNPSYTDNLQFTTFILFKFIFDENVFRGVPKRQLDLKGREIYDIRNDTTAWSDNPALCLYDYMDSSRYGLNIDSTASLDPVSFGEAATYCESKNFTCNMVINVGESSCWSNVLKILKLFRGTITCFNNIYYLKFADLNEESSIMTIDDDMILQEASGKSSVKMAQPGRFDKPLGIRVTYVDAEQDYTEDSFIIGEQDGVVEEFKLDGCTDREMAGIIATSYLERKLVDRTISLVLRDDAILLEPHDIVTVNSTALAISDQVMRVINLSYTSDGFISVVFQYEDLNIYNDVFDITSRDIYRVSLPVPSTPALISNASVEEIIYNYRLTSYIRLDVDFSVPEDQVWFDHVEVWVSTNGDVLANYKHQFNANESFAIDPVQEGAEYYIILRTVNLFNTKQTLLEATKLSHLAVGKSTTRPTSPNPLSATPTDSGLALYSEKIFDPDIEVYEFRLGHQWLGGLFLASLRSPNWNIKSIPGTHSFTLNTKGTNGLYGETSQGATATIPLPKGWSSAYDFTDDFTDSTSGQVFSNTEHIEYNSDDYLKCSHNSDGTSINLVGYYESEVFDVGIGNDDTFYTYVETSYVTVGGGTTWNELWGDSTSVTEIWTYQDTSKTWYDVFEIETAPAVITTIYWKLNIGDDWSTIDHAEIIAGVVDARYFKVRFDIIDPAEGVNVYIQNYTLHLYN